MESAMHLRNSSMGPNPALGMNMMSQDGQDAIIGQVRRLEAALREANKEKDKMLTDMSKMQKKLV